METVLDQARAAFERHEHAPEAVESEVVETEAVEEQLEAVDPEVEAVDEATDEVEAEVSQGPEIKTIAELAEAIDVDAGFLYDIEIGMQDGEEPIKLGQLKDKYKDLRRDLEAEKARAADLEQKASGVMQMTESGQQISAELQQAIAERQKVDIYEQSIDWDKFAADNAGAAALEKQRIIEARQRADGAVAMERQRQQVYQQQALAQARNKMLTDIPEWKDQEVMNREQQEIGNLLLSRGYPPQMVQTFSDPLAVVMLRDYNRLLKQEAEATGAVQNMQRRVPKVLKGGARVKKDNNAEYRKLKDRAKNAPSTTRNAAEMDAARALFKGR